MNNIIRGGIVGIIIILWTSIICKKIENKNLTKYIKLLSTVLIIWIILRTIKYSIIKENSAIILIWYSYYFPILFSSTIFLYICTWNNKNKKYIKILKNISLLGSTILFLMVVTNNLHNLVFSFNPNSANFEKEYTYQIGYYLCFIWIFLNLMFSIITAIKESRGYYKKEKFIILAAILILVFSYAVGYIKRVPIVSNYFRDFTIVYSMFYMLALIIVVYKEKYRQVLEEQLYEEIEDAIKDKAILINKKIKNISNSENPKRDMAYIKMLVSYCKRKSNLIVIEKNRNNCTSEELELFVKETIKDANSLGVFGDVNIINKFEIPTYVASIVYGYVYNLFEYCSDYNSANMFISIEKVKDEININTMIDSTYDLGEFEYNFEMNQFLQNKRIYHNQYKDEKCVNVVLKIPVDSNIIKEKQLNENEIHTLLGIKSKVHDILGQRLSVVSSVLDGEKIDEMKIDEIKPLLKNILDDLDNNKQIKPNDMLMQVAHTCELAGANMYIVGDLPKNYLKAITIVRVIRECN